VQYGPATVLRQSLQALETYVKQMGKRQLIPKKRVKLLAPQTEARAKLCQRKVHRSLCGFPKIDAYEDTLEHCTDSAGLPDLQHEVRAIAHATRPHRVIPVGRPHG